MITAHHATDIKFEQFDFARLGEYTAQNATDETAIRMARLGAWFADRAINDATAQTYDMTCELDINTPYETTFDALWDTLADCEAEDFRAALIRDGYDGIVLKDTEFGCISYIALSADQITITSID